MVFKLVRNIPVDRQLLVKYKKCATFAQVGSTHMYKCVCTYIHTYIHTNIHTYISKSAHS